MKLNNRYSWTLSVLLVLFGFQNCGQPGSIQVTSSGSVSTESDTSAVSVDEPSVPPSTNPPIIVNPPVVDVKYNASLVESGAYICSALGTTTVASDKSGLKCELRYINPLATLSTAEKNNIFATNYFSFNLDYVTKVDAPIFLNDVNVPTRKFDTGFKVSDGEMLKNEKNELLIEYFALKMDSILKLNDSNAEGYYALSIISDDGSKLEAKIDNQWQEIVVNEGPHSARMGCPTRSIYLTKNSRIPIRLYYNQGPRTQIANVLMWKKLNSEQLAPAGANQISRFCGMQSNEEFWQSSLGSTDGPWVKDLYADGWSIVKPSNFLLPDNEVNPCAYSNYQIIDSAKVQVVDQKTTLTISLKEKANLEVNVYEINASQERTKIKSIVLSQFDQTFSLELTELDYSKKYVIEAFMVTQDGLKKIRREYQLNFTKL